jgi:hypothetical protein
MNRRQYVLLVVVTAVAGLVGGLLSDRFLSGAPALAQQRLKVVNAEEFLLVDRFGRTRAGLGLDPDGDLGLVLLGKDGNKKLYLSPDERQALRLMDKDGKVLWAAP